jgi:hypothetical protein
MERGASTFTLVLLEYFLCHLIDIFHNVSEIFNNNIRTTQPKWMGFTADIVQLRMKMYIEFVLEYLKERDSLVDVGVDVRKLVRGLR